MAKQTHILPSGERVLVPSVRSPHLRAPKPLTPEESSQVRSAKRKRTQFERQNPERYQDVTAAMPYHNVGQAYYEAGFRDSGVGPKHYDVQLPGMSSPDAAPRPQRWSEMTDEQRAHTTRGLALHGTSIDQMTHDFGAQLDQGFLRAHRQGASEPYAQRFYSTGEERQRLDSSAKALGVPQSHHAAMNAITSPNTKFKTKSGTYPNDEAAIAATTWAREGHSEPLTSANWKAAGAAKGEVRRGLVSRPANMQKAVHVQKQLDAGVPLAETTGPTGIPVFGEQSPKTGPYANSWSDTHPNFFVSDVHSGGGGMLPHLGTDKDIRVNRAGGTSYSPSGNAQRDKSEREKAIERVPYFHSAADEAARRAMIPRGLGSLREAQAVQWGEEQISRGGKAGMNEESAYAPLRRTQHFHDGMTGSMFEEGHGGQLRVDQRLVHDHGQRSRTAKRLGLDF